MVNLRSNADFVTFMRWLTESRDEQRETNEQLRGENLTEGAVKAQQLTELLGHTAGAPASLARIVSGRRSGIPVPL